MQVLEVMDHKVLLLNWLPVIERLRGPKVVHHRVSVHVLRLEKGERGLLSTCSIERLRELPEVMESMRDQN